MIKSHQERPIDVLWISSIKNLKSFTSYDDNSKVFNKNMQKMDTIENLFPLDATDPNARAGKFLQNTKFVVLANRFHGYESLSSHILKEFISFLMSDNTTAQKILSEFVFVIFPMVNPDGVSNGYSITNTSKDDQDLLLDTNAIADPKYFKKNYPGLFALHEMIRFVSHEYQLESFFELRAPMLNRGTRILGPALHKDNFYQVLMFPYVYSSYEKSFSVKQHFLPDAINGNSEIVHKMTNRNCLYQIFFSVMKEPVPPSQNSTQILKKTNLESRRKALGVIDSRTMQGRSGIKRTARRFGLSFSKLFDVIYQKNYLEEMKDILLFEMQEYQKFFTKNKTAVQGRKNLYLFRQRFDGKD